MPLNHSRSNAEPPFDLEPEPQSKQGFWLELGGGLLLVCGLAGIGLYQWLTEPAFVNPASQAQSPAPERSPTAPGQPRPKPTTAGLPTPGVPAAPEDPRSPALYQVMPKPGTYYAETPELMTSRREIASNNGRFCIKLVNAPRSQASGNPAANPQTLVSSLSTRNDGVYIDATQEKLAVDRATGIIQDALGPWQWLESKVDQDGAMAECLASTAPYRR